MPRVKPRAYIHVITLATLKKIVRLHSSNLRASKSLFCFEL